MRLCAALVVLGGCGRVGFDATAHPADAPDATTVDCSAAFCDGFEDPALARWGVMLENGSTAARDPSFGFRGASLHVTAPVTSTIAARFADVFPTTTTDEWVRVYLYAPSAITLNAEPVELGDPAFTYHLIFSLYDDAVDLHGHNIAGDFLSASQVAPPRDRWTCYELHVAIGAVGTVELYLDGALVAAQPNVDTRGMAGLPRLYVGVTSKPANGVTDLHVDEVVADTKRPGCL